MRPDHPLIETVARAMTIARGHDPDRMVPITGYPADKNNLIPQWHLDVEWAQRHIAAEEALNAGPGPF